MLQRHPGANTVVFEQKKVGFSKPSSDSATSIQQFLSSDSATGLQKLFDPSTFFVGQIKKVPTFSLPLHAFKGQWLQYKQLFLPKCSTLLMSAISAVDGHGSRTTNLFIIFFPLFRCLPAILSILVVVTQPPSPPVPSTRL